MKIGVTAGRDQQLAADGVDGDTQLVFRDDHAETEKEKGEAMTILSDRDTTARTYHQCIWCGGTINVGEAYHRQNISFDGEFQSNAWHPECFTVAAKANVQDGFMQHSFERGTSEEKT